MSLNYGQYLVKKLPNFNSFVDIYTKNRLRYKWIEKIRFRTWDKVIDLIRMVPACGYNNNNSNDEVTFNKAWIIMAPISWVLWLDWSTLCFAYVGWVKHLLIMAALSRQSSWWWSLRWCNVSVIKKLCQFHEWDSHIRFVVHTIRYYDVLYTVKDRDSINLSNEDRSMLILRCQREKMFRMSANWFFIAWAYMRWNEIDEVLIVWSNKVLCHHFGIECSVFNENYERIWLFMGDVIKCFWIKWF